MTKTSVFKDESPESKHPTPVYRKHRVQTADQPPHHGPPTRYLEPNKTENSLAECKELISQMKTNDDSDSDENIQIL